MNSATIERPNDRLVSTVETLRLARDTLPRDRSQTHANSDGVPLHGVRSLSPRATTDSLASIEFHGQVFRFARASFAKSFTRVWWLEKTVRGGIDLRIDKGCVPISDPGSGSMASKRSSRSRWLIFLGLALATPRADGAAPTEWPVKKDADYGHVSVKNFDDSTPNGHLKINTGAGTTIKAASASTGGDIFANGYTATADGISARLKTVEDRLAQLRDDFDDTSVAELTDLSDKCTSVHTSLSAKIDALETDINSTAFTPPECSDDTKMRGIVRIGGEWVCMCKTNYTTGTGGDQSDYGTCDVSPCALPNDFLSDAKVVQNCAETHLKAGAVCEFNCEDGYQPTGLAHDTPGQITCGAIGGSPTSTATTCTACTNSFAGENCKFESCDLDANGFNGAANTVDTGTNDCPARYMTAGSSCNYDCTNDSMPSGETTVDTTGTITCAADGGATTPAAPACTSCDAAGFLGYTGDNCKLASCDITGFQGDLNAVANSGDPCPSSVSYMTAGTDCKYDCANDSMPSGETAVGTTGTITCHANDGSTTPQTPTCVTCDAAGFTDYTGINCQTPSCDVTDVINDLAINTNNMIDSTCGNTMKAGATCTYSCDDSMPTGLTNVGVSRTLTCDTGGTDITAAGFDPDTDSPAPACTACSNEYSGDNCVIPSCDVQSATIGFGGSHLASNHVTPDVTCPGQYLKAGASCPFDCADGFKPSIQPNSPGDLGGEITCDAGGTTASGKTTDGWCVACENQESGVNCETPSCDLTAFGYIVPETTESAVVSSTCGVNSGYLKAAESCEYSCAAGYMPNTFTAPNTPRRVDCIKDSSTAVTTKSGTATDAANVTVDLNSQLTCVTCDTAGFTDYTGINCQTPSCDVTDVINDLTSNTNEMIDSTCGNTMKAGGTCTYSCNAGFMPTGLTNVGVSRTLTCDAGGGAITATGYTAGTDAPACTACTNGSDQVNCVLQTGGGGGGTPAG